MKINVFTLKLSNKYKGCVTEITKNNSELRSKGMAFIDEFLTYLLQCRESIKGKINIPGSINKTYELQLDEFLFEFVIKPDLSTETHVSLTIKSRKHLNNYFLKSAFPNTEGYVYFLTSEYGYKIGMTNNIKRRFKELSVNLPFELTLHSHCQLKEYIELEKILHSALIDKHINGEWFKLNDSDFEYIDEIISKYNTKRFFIPQNCIK